MRRFACVLMWALWLGGCGPRVVVALDPTLPDGDPVPLQPAAQALASAAADTDPGTRGPALAALVSGLPAGELTRWVMQGTYDPEPWVQGQVVQALLERADDDVAAFLSDFAQRSSADPYQRARVAHAWIGGSRGALPEMAEAWVGRPAWRAAPLALVAARLDVAAARPVLEVALATGEVRDAPYFVAALVQHGWPEVAGALADGASRSEADGQLRFDLVRAAWGDGEALASWRAAVRGDAELAQDAVDVVALLPDAAAAPWWKELRRTRWSEVSDVAALLAKPSGSALRRASRHEHAYARAWAQRVVARGGFADADAVVAAGLADPDAVVRERAAQAAGTLGLVGVSDALRTLAADDRSELRAAAYGALLRLGVPVVPSPATDASPR